MKYKGPPRRGNASADRDASLSLSKRISDDVMSNNSNAPPVDPPEDAPHRSRILERLDALSEKIDTLRKERDPERLLTREEAADRLRISVRTLDTLRAAGEIRAVKVKRRVRFHPDALESYIRRAAEGGRT